MTTTYEAAVSLAEQLSPADQARLVMLLAERLQQTLRAEAPADEPDSPAIWRFPIDEPRDEGRAALPLTAEDADRETRAMLTRWFGAELSEEDALALAMAHPY